MKNFYLGGIFVLLMSQACLAMPFGRGESSDDFQGKTRPAQNTQTEEIENTRVEKPKLEIPKKGKHSYGGSTQRGGKKRRQSYDLGMGGCSKEPTYHFRECNADGEVTYVDFSTGVFKNEAPFKKPLGGTLFEQLVKESGNFFKNLLGKNAVNRDEQEENNKRGRQERREEKKKNSPNKKEAPRKGFSSSKKEKENKERDRSRDRSLQRDYDQNFPELGKGSNKGK